MQIRIALLLYASLGNLLTSNRSCSLLDENIYYLVLVTFDLATKDVTQQLPLLCCTFREWKCSHFFMDGSCWAVALCFLVRWLCVCQTAG